MIAFAVAQQIKLRDIIRSLVTQAEPVVAPARPEMVEARKLPRHASDLGRRAMWHNMSSLQKVLVITVIWRLVMVIIGIAAHYVPLPGTASFSLLKFEGWSANPLTLALDAGVRYDAVWYGAIAQHGYVFKPGAPFSTINFYPLFPLLVKAGSVLTGNVWVTGMVLSNACLLGAIAVLHEWMKMRGLQKQAPLAVLLLLVFPGSVFFGFMYTESLYLLLCLATLVLYERSRYSAAAACAFLLTLTRPTGILIIVWMVLVSVQKRTSWKAWVPVAGTVLGVAAFAVYQRIVFGTATAQIQAAASWPVSGRSVSQGISDLMLRPTPGHPVAALVMLELSGICFLVIVPLVYRYFGSAYAAYAMVSIVGPTVTGLASYQRYLSVVFLVPVALAIWRSKRHDRVANLTVFAWLWWNLVFTLAAAALYVSEGGAF